MNNPLPMPLGKKLKSVIYQTLVEYGVLEMGTEVPAEVEFFIAELVFVSKELADGK